MNEKELNEKELKDDRESIIEYKALIKMYVNSIKTWCDFAKMDGIELDNKIIMYSEKIAKYTERVYKLEYKISKNTNFFSLNKDQTNE